MDVISGNSTTVAYINKVGGTSGHGAGDTTSFLWPATCLGTRTSLWMPCPGGATVTDRVDPPQCGDQSNLSTLTNPIVDLFASEKNHKLPVFFTIRLSPSSSGVNAPTQNRECLYGYAYPPTALVPRVLRKLRLQPTAQILLVASQGSAN